MGPELAAQARSLASALPHAYHDLIARAAKAEWFRAIFGASKIDPKAPEPAEIVSGATSLIAALLEMTGGLVLVFFLGVYGALDPRAYMRPVLLLVPPARR